MKFNLPGFLLLSSVAVLLSSCLKTATETTYSNNPCFTSLSLAKNDSLKAGVFTLEPIAGTKDSMIVNLDSMYYGTTIKSAYPTFSFKSSTRQTLFDTASKDSVHLDGTDTIDFRKSYKIKNYAADGITWKEYLVKVNVHQVQPELYVWNKNVEGVEAYGLTNQKAIVSNDTIYYYMNNGTDAHLYTTKDGVSLDPKPLTGFPVSFSLQNMVLFNGKLYVADNNDKYYTSSDRLNWVAKVDPNYNLCSLISVFKGALWAVVQSKTDLKKYQFATTTDGVNWVPVPNIEIPQQFPVKDFTSISFASRNGVPRTLVIGGTSKTGDKLVNRWSSEDGSYWVDFSLENHTLDTLALGSSVIAYDKKLLLFGTRTDNKKVVFKESIDEGLSWYSPDSVYNYLHRGIHEISSSTKNDTITSYVDYQVHKYMSVVVLNPKSYERTNFTDKSNPASLANEIIQSNRIFIFGVPGSASSSLDVWTGKLNRKNFLRQ